MKNAAEKDDNNSFKASVTLYEVSSLILISYIHRKILSPFRSAFIIARSVSRAIMDEFLDNRILLLIFEQVCEGHVSCISMIS